MAKQKQDLKKSKSIELGIGDKNRQAIVKNLNQFLADEYLLYTKTRNYHWNVQGMSFGSLHELFEKQYTQLAVVIDDTAERIRSLGYFSPGSMDEFLQMSRLVETGHLDGDARKMIANLVEDHETIIQILRHDIDEIEEDDNDVGTADFLTATIQMHEKMAWMLRSHLG